MMVIIIMFDRNVHVEKGQRVLNIQYESVSWFLSEDSPGYQPRAH